MLSEERRAGWFWMTQPPPKCCGLIIFASQIISCFPDHFFPCGASPARRDLQPWGPAAGACEGQRVHGGGGDEEGHKPDPARISGYRRGA